MAYSEADLQDAIKALQAKKYSLRKIACEFSVLPSTLYKRYLQTHQTRTTAFELLQILSPAQEERLAKWALMQQSLGYPPSYTQLQEFANQILYVARSNHSVGKH